MHEFFLCDVFLVTHVGKLTHLRPLDTQMSQVGKKNSVGRYTHSHQALFPVLEIPKPKSKLQLKTKKQTTTSPQCAFAFIQPPMTQGQEIKVKLHTMNLLATGSPLQTLDLFLSIYSKYGGTSVTFLFSLTVPFPFFQMKK